MTSGIDQSIATISGALDQLEELDFDELDISTLIKLENRLHHLGRRATRLSSKAKYREVHSNGVVSYEPRYRVRGGLDDHTSPLHVEVSPS